MASAAQDGYACSHAKTPALAEVVMSTPQDKLFAVPFRRACLTFA